MENIFIDTSIFIKENFLEGKRLQQLLKLGEEKQIRLILTRVTVNEIKARFKKTINAYKEQASKFYSLKNLEVGKEILSSIASLEAEDAFNSILDEILKKSKAVIIEYGRIDIVHLMSNYFDEKPPFNSKNKKNEFPDAIAIQLLEEWCRENKEVVKTISTDKDFEGYASKFVTHEQSYESYIDQKLKSFELYQKRIEILNKVFLKNSDSIDNEIKDWYKRNLDDTTLYYSFIYFEIHDIEEANVEVVDKEFKITYIDEESIEIEIIADVYFTVDLTIDDEEYSVYDDDIKERIYMETKTETIERDVKAKVTAVAFIEDIDSYDDTLEIIDINKGIKLKIDTEHGYR